MPKFSTQEKEVIKEKLVVEAERLFVLYGFKKVSIDEIVKAVGIAKGSFYVFYPSKEHLFFEILTRLQTKIWDDMESLLIENRSLSPRELCKTYILMMLDSVKRYPLLKQMDSETTNYLYRKLPPEVIEAHTKDDSEEVVKLQEYGIYFTCGVEIATKTLQTLAVSFLNLQQENVENQRMIMDIILDGVLKEIVSDEHN